MYSIQTIANSFLKKAQEARIELTHLKLQRLCYFLYDEYLHLHKHSICAEKPKAYPEGPVFDSLYRELKGLGDKPVADYLLELSPVTFQLESLFPTEWDQSYWRAFNRIWDSHGKEDQSQLDSYALHKNEAWSKTRNELKLVDIPEHYFSARLMPVLPD